LRFGTAIGLCTKTTIKNNKMKKLIVSLVMIIPFIGFAQNSISENIDGTNNNTNPFATIETQHKVSTEYLDIAQTAAILDIGNTQRRTRGASTSSTSIPRSTVSLEMLTTGLESTDSTNGKVLLKSIFEK